jgi:hypothetical protein
MMDYLLIERVLSGTESAAKSNAKERDFCAKYKPAFDIGRMAHRFTQGYYAHQALIDAGSDERANALVETTGTVARKDGTKHVFDMRHYLDYGRTAIVDDLQQVWLIGALIAAGDRLESSQPYYLSRAPLLEFVFHLRNAAAHGGGFHFTTRSGNPRGIERLKRYEAHNKEAQHRTADFEIMPSVEGLPLFAFMGAADVIDVLTLVEIYLTRIRERINSGELLDDGSLVVRPPRP